MNLADEQWEFIESEVRKVARRDALSRGKGSRVYKKNVRDSDPRKEELKRELV